MPRAYLSTGIFLAGSDGAGLGADWNPRPTGGHSAGWNPRPTGGSFAGWNPHPTGGHDAGWNPEPVRGQGLNPYPIGPNGNPTQNGEPGYDPATGSPWPWRRFDPDWTYASGDALMAQALRKVRARLIGERDVRRSPAAWGKVGLPKSKDNPLWRWGSEFRQQAVVGEMLGHTVVRGTQVYFMVPDFDATPPGAGLHLLIRIEPPGADINVKFDYSQQIDKVLRAAVEREERLPEILCQAMDFRPFFDSLTGLDRLPTPHVDELILVAWAWATHVVMALKNNIAEYRPVERSSLVMPIIATPSHGSLPSGHATLAALTAHLLQALLQYPAGDRRPPLLHHLASRIAFNRVVAGVHFQMDSFVGCHLGHRLASLFLGMARGAQVLPAKDPVVVAADSQWGEGGSPGLLPSAPEIPAPRIDTLQDLWTAATQELTDLNFI